MAHRIVPIRGMTCAACETTVAEAARALPGVRSAAANRRTGGLTLDGDRLPTDRDVAAALASTPYSVGARPWLSRSHAVWRDLAVTIAAVSALGMLAWALGLDARVQDLTQGASAGSALVVLGLGVAASVSTCMALVGGLVISIASSVPSRASGLARVAPHLAFNAGRIAGFAALGALVGLVGRSISPSGALLGAVVLLAALVMLVVGVRLTEASPRVAAWQLALPGRWGRWAQGGRPLDRRRAGARLGDAGHRDARHGDAGRGDARRGRTRTALLGAATFFLPCGFTQAVQVYALATGSPRDGAIVMALFAVGTTPGLLAGGLAASTARRASGRALRVVGVVVVAFALVTAAGAVTQVAPGLRMATVQASERTANVIDVGGVQRVRTAVRIDGYDPATTVVYADEPVSWTLEPEYFGCASLVDASSVGLDRIDVLYGAATVEFTPTETGTYPYSCAMGMYTGAFVVIERPAA